MSASVSPTFLMPAPRVWLVTGASSGFGQAIVQEALTRGDSVVALVRNASSIQALKDTYGPDRLLILRCDVAYPDQISTAFAAASAHFHQFDVVVNSAGYAILSEIENTPEDAARQLFDVNFWGTVSVSKEAIKFFREKGSGGRLFNISSGAGIAGTPGLAYYSASKHAVEGFTESLAKELIPSWNIKISLLEPGAFKTRAHKENIVEFPEHEAYANSEAPTYHVRQWFKDGTGITGDVNRAAKKIYEFSELENPPFRWQIGKDMVQAVKEQLRGILKESERLESWSDNLTLDK